MYIWNFILEICSRIFCLSQKFVPEFFVRIFAVTVTVFNVYLEFYLRSLFKNFLVSQNVCSRIFCWSQNVCSRIFLYDSRDSLAPEIVFCLISEILFLVSEILFLV